MDGALSRRGLLGGAVGLAVVAAVKTGGNRLGSLVAVGRVKGSGSSTTRCAQCGGRDHSMLSANCPAAPGVL
jgi:hypothetical protein